MKITESLIKKLLRLIQGETIPSSAIASGVISELLDEGLLTPITRGSRVSYRAIRSDALKSYLETHYEEMRNFYKTASLMKNPSVTRAELASDSGNSKLVAVRSCPGFPVNSYEPIPCKINGTDCEINPVVGTFTFIADWRTFIVPENVIVVGVENMENFRMVTQQKALFEAVYKNTPLLFVSRYPQSGDLRDWLLTIPNRYVHFGDFDLAGIHIFLTEFYKHLGARSSFFIPEDIENRLQRGSIERYNSQYQKFKNLETDIPYLQHLVDMINKYHRCYDQEGYIL